jgi:hypothetical protein
VRISEIRVENFRSIADSGSLALDSINVLVGPNNSGKSSLINAIYQLQAGSPAPGIYVRKGALNWQVTAKIQNPNSQYQSFAGFHHSEGGAEIVIAMSSGSDHNRSIGASDGRTSTQGQGSNVEPQAWIYPVLSKRRVMGFQPNADRASAKTIRVDWSYLPARLSVAASQDFPGSGKYREACKQILGFVVTTIPAENGIQAGRYLDQNTTIELDAMGEGVTSIVGLLVELATAEKKLFLIEEPENDLHPAALKALLELIIDSSQRNQFLISTHSSIVVRYLGAVNDAVILKVGLDDQQNPPATNFTPVESTPAGRMEVLNDLGYELSDFDLFDAWLILEESSAETLVRQYFTKWFAPKLVGRLRTIAAQGTGDVGPKFRDLERLLLFGHLEGAYKSRVWVLCDGDDSGKTAIDSLRAKFKDWPEQNFLCLAQTDLEFYYPPRFQQAITATMDLHGVAKREAKLALFKTVIAFIEKDEMHAKKEFEGSAVEFISVLREIECAVVKNFTGR